MLINTMSSEEGNFSHSLTPHDLFTFLLFYFILNMCGIFFTHICTDSIGIIQVFEVMTKIFHVSGLVKQRILLPSYLNVTYRVGI